MADFAEGSTQITFPVGVRTVCFNIPVLEDDITEDNEIFEIVATPSVGGSPTTISVCIRDNDSKRYPICLCIKSITIHLHIQMFWSSFLILSTEEMKLTKWQKFV